MQMDEIAAKEHERLTKEESIDTAPRDGSSFEAFDPAFGWVECHWYVHPSVQGWVSDEIDCNEYEFSPRSWRPSNSDS